MERQAIWDMLRGNPGRWFNYADMACYLGSTVGEAALWLGVFIGEERHNEAIEVGYDNDARQYMIRLRVRED